MPHRVLYHFISIFQGNRPLVSADLPVSLCPGFARSFLHKGWPADEGFAISMTRLYTPRMEYPLDKLIEQENALQFDSFDEDDAWRLGCAFVEKAQAGKLGITIDISTKDKVLFHCNRKGTNPDNEHWVVRKKNAVNRFGHSSWYVGQKLRELKLTLEQKYMVSESEYAAHGGSFPLAVRGVGIIGTVTVSGLTQEEDHALVVEVLAAFLRKN